MVAAAAPLGNSTAWLRRCVMRKPLRIEAAAREGLAGKGGLRIRLVHFGRKKLPYYRIIIAQSRSRRDGRFLEMVGHCNPMPGFEMPNSSDWESFWNRWRKAGYEALKRERMLDLYLED